MNSTRQWPLAAVIVTAALFLANALWIPAKASLAQVLLEAAWQRTLAGAVSAKPWPWADTSPVAVLEVPRLGIRQFVLAGASGRNLAFGPATITDVTLNDVLISGHRDTHFRFLGELEPGDELNLQTPQGSRIFKVTFTEVVDSQLMNLVLEKHRQRLTLITCFPFDAVLAGGPLRYVVTAMEH